MIPVSKASPEKLSLLEEIKRALSEATEFSCDLETTGVDPHSDRITRFSFATRTQKWAIRVRDYELDLLRAALRPLFLVPSKLIVFHNFKFDGLFLRYFGIEVKSRVACTMIMSWLWDEDSRRYSHGLKECVLRELNHRMATYEEATGLFGNIQEYAGEDAVWTLKLYDYYLKLLEQWNLLNDFWNIEMPMARILLNIEFRGVRLNEDILKKLKSESFEELEKRERLIHFLAALDKDKLQEIQVEFNTLAKQLEQLGQEDKILDKQIEAVSKIKPVPRKFEVSSPAQCAKILFDELKIGMREDGTNEYSVRGKTLANGRIGQFSTDDDVLKMMAMDNYAIADALLGYRKINTRNNNFIKPLLERCRISDIIHPQFLQIGTVSGRFASKEPNYQNLPRKGGVRAAFIARQGYKIIRSDFSQAELRLMAHFSQDPVMIENYRKNGDIHQITADACGLKGKDGRQAAKAINFGLIYRMSAKRLQGQLALEAKMIISLEQAESYVKKYFQKYAKVREFHRRVEEQVKNRLKQNGKFGFVKLLSGRYRRLDAEYLTNPMTAYTAVTQAINSIIQGGVADIIKCAMIDIEEEFQRRGWLDPERGVWDAYLQGQVHDEVFVEAKEEIAEEAKKIVIEKMMGAGVKFNICVPMTTDASIVDNLSKG